MRNFQRALHPLHTPLRLTFILTLASLGIPSHAASSETAIFFSADTAGHVGPCTACPDGVGKGGLARRAGLLNDMRKASGDDWLLLDAGNALMGSESAASNGRVIAEAYQHMGYDAVNISHRDLRYGRDALTETVRDTELPAVSANLRDADSGERLFPAYRRISANDKEFAVVGITEKPAGMDRLPHLRERLEGVIIDAPAESLRRTLAESPDDTPVILLYYGGASSLRSLRPVLDEAGNRIRLVLVAGQREDELPANGETPPLAAAPQHGQGLVKISPYGESEVLIIDPDSPEDKTVRDLVDAHTPPTSSADLSTGEGPTSDATWSWREGTDIRTSLLGKNRSLGIAVDRVRLLDEYEGKSPPPGNLWLVLDTAIENRLAFDLVLELDYPEAVLIAELQRQLYLLVNGKEVRRLSRPMDRFSESPPSEFTLAGGGSFVSGELVFAVPEDGVDSLSLRYYHDEYAPVVVPLRGDTETEDRTADPVARGSNHLVEVSVFDSERVPERNGTPAPDGMEWLVVDLRGRSLWKREVDALALDADANPNAKADLGKVVEYLKAPALLQLVVDGGDAYVRNEDTSNLLPEPAFLPDVIAGGLAVFPIPANAESAELVLDFPQFGGAPPPTVPDRIRLPLLGDPDGTESPDPLAVIEDNPLPLSILGGRTASSFGKHQANPGQQLVLFDVSIANLSEEGGLYEPRGRARLRTEDGTDAEFLGVVLRGGVEAPEQLWIPAGNEPRRFTFVFATPDTATGGTFNYSGVSRAELINIDWSDADATTATVTRKSPPPDATDGAPETATGKTPASAAEPSHQTQPIETTEKEASEPATATPKENKTKAEPKAKAKPDTPAAPPVYRPHPEAVKADLESDPIVWDARKPLEIEMPKGSNSDVFIKMKLPPEWVDRMWDLDIRMDVIDKEPPMRIYGEPGDRYAVASYKLRPSMTLTGFSVDGEIVKWSIRGAGSNSPAWRISLAITDVRPVPDERITRPASEFDAPFDADGRLELRGELAEKESQYFRYRFDGEPELWRLTADSTDGALRDVKIMERSGRGILSKNRTREGTHAIEISDFYVYPGEYVVRIRGNEQNYSLRWEREKDIVARTGMAVPEGEPEREPNVDRSLAHPLRWNEPWIGRLRTSDDTDMYRFFIPSRHPERVRLRVIPPEDAAIRLRMPITGDRWNGETGESYESEHWFLPGDHYISLQSNSESEGFYQIEIERLPFAAGPTAGESEASPEDLVVNISPHFPDVNLAAHWPYSQTIEGTWEIRSNHDEPLSLDLTLHSGHAGMEARWMEWEGPEQTVEILPGETLTLPVELIVHPDVRADYPLPLDLHLSSEDSSRTHTATRSFDLDVAAEPMGSHTGWPLPDALLGGLNVASIHLGARPLGDASSVSREEALFRGMVRPRARFTPELNKPFRVELAGDEPQPVAGFALHPMHNIQSGHYHWLKDFQIESSLDGEKWTVVLEDALDPWAGEQAFVLPEPIEARYLRLTGLSRQDGTTSGRFGIGALKAIAPPGHRLDEEPVDIATTVLGGHLVYSSPLLNYNGFLGPDPGDSKTLTLRDSDYGQTVEWVIGFHHNRAALVDGVQLRYRPRSGQEDYPRGEALRIFAATDSPLGPWTEIGVWSPPDGAPETWEIAFDNPVFARFLRFTYPPGWEDADQSRSSLLLPSKLRIWEAPPSENYLPIFGEWGHYNRRGSAEYFGYIDTEEAASIEEFNPGGPTRAEARPLSLDEWSGGYVLTGEREAWFSATVSEDDNRLRIDLAGLPDIAFEYTLEDEAGEPVPYLERDGGEHGGITLEAKPDPGTYYLRLWEPKRNIAIAWDNSGSMGPYLDILYASLTTFLQEVDPERERVQLLAYARTPHFILPEWSGDPPTLIRTLRNYDRDDSSSNSETSLLYISDQMRDLDGTKAMIVLTDAETYSYGQTEDMWKSFAHTNPRMFTVETSSGGSRWTQDLMQDWASANHGVYDFMRSVGEVEIAFARANAHLRRPKIYRVRGDGVYIEPPAPGTLETIPEEPPAGTYYFIFDASGSMKAPMDDQTKLDIARDAVRSVIEELPANARAALRVYGHRKRAIDDGADEDTKLEIRMGDLSAEHRAAFVQILDRLRPMGRTPLTLSLQQAISDIGNPREPVTLVLLTDGGDDTRTNPVPVAGKAAAVENLHVFIVGFDIHRRSWSRQLKAMADAANAEYLPADEASQLEPMLRLASGFTPSALEVIDAYGETVAQGEFGDTFKLLPGTYTIRTEDGSEKSIRIQTESTTTLQPFQ